jgi:hypothetical protein
VVTAKTAAAVVMAVRTAATNRTMNPTKMTLTTNRMMLATNDRPG